MSENTKPILFVDTTSQVPQRAASAAIDYARHFGAPLRIIDVLDDSMWTVNTGGSRAQEVVSTLEQVKTEKLAEMLARAQEAGLDATAELLHGTEFVEIIREVQRGGHDILFKTMMGQDDDGSTKMGGTARHLLRKCPSRVFLVHPKMDSITHVLAALGDEGNKGEGHEMNQKVLQSTVEMSKWSSAAVEVLHVWRIFGEHVLSKRLSLDELDMYVDEERGRAMKLVRTVLDEFKPHLTEDQVRLEQGDAKTVIPGYAAQHGVDLVVMGTFARSGIKGFLIGNTAEEILARLKCSVLAIKPEGFESPVV